jgi:two-component system, LytTR family, sensor kinase
MKEKQTQAKICERIFQNFVMEKSMRIWRHLLLLLLMAILFLERIVIIFEAHSKYDTLVADKIVMLNLAVIFFSFFFIYLNIFYFIPKFLIHQQYITYLICLVIILILDFSIFTWLSFLIIKAPNDAVSQSFTISQLLTPVKIVESLTLSTIFIGATTGLLLFKEWMLRERKLKEMESVNLRNELAQLKNQMNPHFLFNTLNNINTLIDINPKKASAVVLGLSEVLRYNLYEVNYDKVLLKKDVEMYAQLLELEKIRRDNFEFTIEIDDQVSSILIYPQLFINFIENAIKHSSDYKERSFVNIRFELHEGKLLFSCLNSKANYPVERNAGGIGLKNITRRLELLYNDTHSLTILDEETQFKVTLILPL